MRARIKVEDESTGEKFSLIVESLSETGKKGLFLRTDDGIITPIGKNATVRFPWKNQ